MEQRPRIKLTLTANDIFLEFMGYSLTAMFWFFYFLWETGELFLPMAIIATLLYTMLSVLIRFPHLFNYPVPVTKANAAIQYRNAVRFIRYLKTMVVVFFFSLSILAEQTSSRAMLWFVPVMLILVFFSLARFIRKSYRNK